MRTHTETTTQSRPGLSEAFNRHFKILAVTGGKGGIGKSMLAINLAVALSEIRKKVVLLDGCFGLANLDMLAGFVPPFHIGDVLFGNKKLNEIMLKSPHGFHLIPAASGFQRLTDLSWEECVFIFQNTLDLDLDTDYLIADTPGGISRGAVNIALLADEVFVLSTPDPAAMFGAYALIKTLVAEDPNKPIHLLVNEVQREPEAWAVFSQINEVVRQFLNRGIAYLGHVKLDPCVRDAIRNQVSVVQRYPHSPATACIREIANVINQTKQLPGRPKDICHKRSLSRGVTDISDATLT